MTIFLSGIALIAAIVAVFASAAGDCKADMQGEA